MIFQVNEEKIKSNYGIFEEEVKRLDDKNQQFSNDVLEKHNYIKELIGDTKTSLQVTKHLMHHIETVPRMKLLRAVRLLRSIVDQILKMSTTISLSLRKQCKLQM